ncbi:hypothetical protein GW17_00013779 [Ensete ventricosum]|nr:hypothetical protein GW17_00013779 [Ensete ventricosum]
MRALNFVSNGSLGHQHTRAVYHLGRNLLQEPVSPIRVGGGGRSYRGMSKVAGELDCSRAHIHLRELDKSDDKANMYQFESLSARRPFVTGGLKFRTVPVYRALLGTIWYRPWYANTVQIGEPCSVARFANSIFTTRYADRAVPPKIDRRRSIAREKGRKKKKRKKKKKKKRGEKRPIARARSLPVRRHRLRAVPARGSRVLFLPCGEKDRGDVLCFDLYRPVWAVHIGPTGYVYVDHPLSGGTFCLLAREQGNEATPRLPTPGRGAASSSSGRTRCRLVFQQMNEAMPRLLARERGATSFSCGDETRYPARRGDTSRERRRLVSLRREKGERGDASSLCVGRRENEAMPHLPIFIF